jgi:hypothetical protein
VTRAVGGGGPTAVPVSIPVPGFFVSAPRPAR